MSAKSTSCIVKPLILSAILAAGTFATAQATTVAELNDAIDLINDGETCDVEKVVFARGIQSYKYTEEGWMATGPLAELYDTDYLDSEDEEIAIGNNKIGTHYQHLAKPAWEFPEGRVIVESASSMPSPDGSNNVAWLNVKLVDGYVVKGPHRHVIKYNRLYRVLTEGGVSPLEQGDENETMGSGYTTFYVFLTCEKD